MEFPGRTAIVNEESFFYGGEGRYFKKKNITVNINTQNKWKQWEKLFRIVFKKGLP